MNDKQLSRYSRHLLLPGIDTEGQEILLGSRVLIVGLGGLGSPAALYLAASGVGTLVLCDGDQVELSNLQRQILHSSDELGRPKTASAQARLAALNPEVRIITIPRRLAGAELQEHVRQADVVVDCSDNFPTRFALNAACVRARTALVSGSAIRTHGQIAVFRADKNASPCYECLYQAPGAKDNDQENCADSGVFAPLTGLVGSLQAAETLKILLSMGTTLEGHLLRIDALSMDVRRVRLRSDPECPACGKTAAPQPALEARARSG